MNISLEYTKDILLNHGGLIALTQLIQKVPPKPFIDFARLEHGSAHREYSNADIIKTMLAMLCMGFSAFEDVDQLRHSPLPGLALGMERLPSRETLRQRLDRMASHEHLLAALNAWSLELLRTYSKPSAVRGTKLIPVDFDVTLMDNSNSAKEGIAQTYKKDLYGYAPMMTYLGAEGYLLNQQFRPGNTHSNTAGTLDYILHSLQFARMLCPQATLLARFDSGNDAQENLYHMAQLPQVYFLVKHLNRGKNARAQEETLIQYVLDNQTAKEEVPGRGSRYFAEKPALVTWTDEHGQDQHASCRLILSVVEITHDLNEPGQPLLIPHRQIHLWRTNLPRNEYPPQAVIALYRDHATCEQFHSEYKSDLDLERMPSGKFATNALVARLGQLAYNLLRILGQRIMKNPLYKLKRPQVRIRIRKVILKLIYIPCQCLIKHRQWCIKLPRDNPMARILYELTG